MYPRLENHLKLCFLDQAATVLRDLGELGEQLIGLTGDNLNDMASADFIVIHPTLPTLGLGPSVKDSLSTFYLPLKTFLQGPSNLPQRFFYDELSPAWTQLAIRWEREKWLIAGQVLSSDDVRTGATDYSP